MSLALVGEAPSRTAERPFDGRSGRRIEELVGRALPEAFDDVRNLLDEWPGRMGKGSAFPPDAAREAAERCLAEVTADRLILAGKRVARAFGLRGDFLEWQPLGDGRMAAVIPHPSGIVRTWNDEESVARVRAFLMEALECS